MREIVYILFCILSLSIGCSVAKKASAPGVVKESGIKPARSLQSVINNNISNYDFYIQRADIVLQQEDFTVRLNAAVKFRKPDSLVISVKTKAGIEAGRALVTKDTLIINDRINRSIIIADAKAVRSKYGIHPVYIFAVLGDLIIDEKERVTNNICSKGGSLQKFLTFDRRIEYTVDCNKSKAVGAFFEGDIRSRNLEFTYSDFFSAGNIRIPGKIQVADDFETIKILVEIRKIIVDWPGPVNFSTGSNYKVIKIG